MESVLSTYSGNVLFSLCYLFSLFSQKKIERTIKFSSLSLAFSLKVLSSEIDLAENDVFR
jgi:hypothetical protein